MMMAQRTLCNFPVSFIIDKFDLEGSDWGVVSSQPDGTSLTKLCSGDALFFRGNKFLILSEIYQLLYPI